MKNTLKHQQYPKAFKQTSDNRLSSDESSDSQEDSFEKQNMMEREMVKIKEELKNVPYELLLRQMNVSHQKDDKKSPKVHKLGKKIKKLGKQKVEKSFKNEAVEVSIHSKPTKKKSTIFQSQRRKAIDPRFQSYAGNYNPDLAMKTYSFIPQLQKAEINQLKSKLKNPSNKNKLKENERQVLSKQYNRLTGQVKNIELMQLQKSTKKQLKTKFGQDYHLSKKTIKHEFQRKKLEQMSHQQRQKKMKQKLTKLQKQQIGQRRKLTKPVRSK